MLFRKMFREIGKNFGQFFSIFILSFLAVSLFTIFKSSDIGAFRAIDRFHKQTNIAKAWLYGENFDYDALQKIKNIDDVKDAQLRTELKASSVEQNQAQLELFIQEDNIIIKPLSIEGDDYDPSDRNRLWISEKFAKEWNLSIGDSYSLNYNGRTITKEIGGFIASPEFEYMCADSDLETDYKKIGYVYMSYKGFAQDMLSLSISDYSDNDLVKMIPFTQILITSDKDNILSMEEDIKDALDGKYAVFTDKESIKGIKVFEDEIEQHEQFAVVFAVVFMLIALMVIMTTMNRMISNQRVQIGTMNAIGMKNGKILRHYMGYSFFVSFIGVVTGLLIGPLWWGKAFTRLFSTMYVLPDWRTEYDYSFFVVGILVVLCCTLSSFFSCCNLLKIKPSESLRPAPPKTGKKCIFENLPFWKYLGFNTQYDLRDISRAKLRAFMCVFGTACGMVIVACAMACTTTIANVKEWSFSKLQNYDYTIQFADHMTLNKAQELSEQYDGELTMTKGIEIATEENALSEQKKTTTIVVTEGKGLNNITDVNQNVVKIPKGTIAISSKLAKKLNVKEGDIVYWHIHDKNEWRKSKIGVINRNPTISGITMLRDDYETEEASFEPTFLYTKQDVTGVEKDNDDITVVHNKSDMLSAFESTMEIMNLLIAIFYAFAIVLIAVVLYNSGNLSFHERVKEFATLKVLGFQSNQIRKILSIQNLWLSIIGVIIGMPFAKILLQYMFDSNGDSFDFEAVVAVHDYIFAGLFVLIVSVLVSFMFSKKIRKLDMVEVLKGME